MSSAETLDQVVGIEHSDEIQFIDTARLEDHPANPPERVEAEAVKALAASIEEFGQREPARVRIYGWTTIGGERCAAYQVLSGHRRVAACRILGRDVRAEIVDCDDNEAIKEVLLGNADRQDLDPIQRAELLRSMIDCGVDRAEAGRMFGLESDSGVKNLLRLLELPESMRALVREGVLPARAARYAVPFAEAVTIVDGWSKKIRSHEWAKRNASENPKSFFVVETSGAHHPDARPVDGRSKYQPSYSHKKTARKFDLDEATREKLQIVSLPIGPKGKMVEVAQNVELFDQLNKPHLVEADRYAPKRKKPAAKPDAATMTTAELAAAKRAKAAEQAKRLKEAMPQWRRRFTRCLLGCHTPANHAVIHSTLPWMVAAANDREWIKVACQTLSALVHQNGWHDQASSMIASMIATCDDMTGLELSDRLWRILMWPQILAWPVGPISASYGPDAVDDDWSRLRKQPPKKMPFESGISAEDLDESLAMMFAFADLSYAGGWREAAKPGPERDMLLEYLNLHSSDQIDALAKKWNVNIAAASTKGAKVEAIAADHSAKKPLPLPEILLPGKPAKRKKV